LLTGVLALWMLRRTRSAIGRRVDRAVVAAVRRFRFRLDRYKLVSRRTTLRDLLQDHVILAAIRAEAQAQRVSEAQVRARVEQYVAEIVPYFNVLSYYKFGYNAARILLGLLYRVTVAYDDRAELESLPRRDVVVYLMNHRSNADYVVLAYVLARAVSISYAVGEWARVWPLEYMFKSFGAYFVRRGFRDQLYHTVLRRYVQLITRNGVTQGIFLEGGLSRDGGFRTAKIGLLDYIAGTLPELGAGRDIHLVPVAVNYDRVLEDRTLIAELVEGERRPGRIRQFVGVVQYVGTNLIRLATGRLRRYGRVAVQFGRPISVGKWSTNIPELWLLSREERLPRIQGLADDVMREVADIIPVTPVPLVAAAILSFGRTVIDHNALLEVIQRYRDHLRHTGARLIRPERTALDILDRAWRTLHMRRLVVREPGGYVVLPRHRPLLEYYANSVTHLLPGTPREPVMHPDRGPDDSLPKLRPWRPV